MNILRQNPLHILLSNSWYLNKLKGHVFLKSELTRRQKCEMGRNLARWNFGENGRQGHTWNLRSGRLVEEGSVNCEEGCHCHYCYRCSVDGYDLLSFKVLTRSYLWKYVLRYNHCPISEQLLEIYGGENIEGDYFYLSHIEYCRAGALQNTWKSQGPW